MLQQLSELGINKNEKAALFAYLFRRITNERFRELVNDPINLKRRVDRSGYILKNCKLFAWAHYKAKYITGTATPRAKDYGVAPADASFLRRLNLDHIPRKYPAFTLSDFDTIMGRYIDSKDLNHYIGKFISKKMTFLIKSYGESREEIHSYLIEHAIYSIYRKYPYFSTFEHMSNVGKTGLRNRGHSFIIQKTAKKNQKLVQNNDGTFESLHVNIDAVANTIAQEQPETCVLDELTLSPKATRFIAIMRGMYDEEFSAFLGENNAEAAHTMRFNSYSSQVRAYFKVSQAQVRKLFIHIQEQVRAS